MGASKFCFWCFVWGASLGSDFGSTISEHIRNLVYEDSMATVPIFLLHIGGVYTWLFQWLQGLYNSFAQGNRMFGQGLIS